MKIKIYLKDGTVEDKQPIFFASYLNAVINNDKDKQLIKKIVGEDDTVWFIRYD